MSPDGICLDPDVLVLEEIVEVHVTDLEAPFAVTRHEATAAQVVTQDRQVRMTITPSRGGYLVDLALTDGRWMVTQMTSQPG